jgi:hypothetical protein
MQFTLRVSSPPSPATARNQNLPCAICVGPGHAAVRLDPSSESCCNLPAFVFDNAADEFTSDLALDRAGSQQENNFGTKNFGKEFRDTHRNSRARLSRLSGHAHKFAGTEDSLFALGLLARRIRG